MNIFGTKAIAVIRYFRNKAYIFELNLVLVLVNGAWRALGDILLHGQLSQEHLGLVLTLGMAESVVGLGCLVGEWQLTEGGPRLLAVQLDRQLVQSYTKKAS